MSNNIRQINEKLISFNKKYYLNLLIRGLLLSFSFIIVYYILAALLEYNLWLSRPYRLLILLLFFAGVVYCFYRFLKEPIAWWIYRRGLNQEVGAKIIGAYFPSIGDRLLNLIQLSKLEHASILVEASIDQRSKQFEPMYFDSAIDLKDNKKYLRYLIVPFVLLLILFLLNQNIFTQSTARILQFNKEFSPQAPFTFEIQNENLLAFFNEDFTLSLNTEGSSIPEAVYVVYGSQRLKMERIQTGSFIHTFDNLQNDISFRFEAAGFFSSPSTIQMINRPELINLKVLFNYPAYLGKRNDELTNTGNLLIPEGTKVSWKIETANALKALIKFGALGDVESLQLSDNQIYVFDKSFFNPEHYSILLSNEHSENKERIQYHINVIKDQHPQINIEHLRDSILYKSIHLGGTLIDDYGITGLKVNYEIQHKNETSPSRSIEIPIHHFQAQQNFFFSWPIDSLQLQPGDRLTYYLQVWDNDGVNGRKSTKSSVYVFNLPGKEEFADNIRQSQSAAQSQMQQSVQHVKELNKAIEDAQQKLKGKQVLDYQDRKMLEDLLQQKMDLEKMIGELQKQNELLDEKKDAFSEQSEKIKEKAEQLQKLLDELLDEETKKLFEELEKLLNEKSDLSQIQQMLEQMQRNENTLEKEMERTLELFKQLQYEYKLEQAIEALNNQLEKQEKLLEKTEEKATSEKNEKGDSKDQNKDGKENSDNQSLAKEQEELLKEFEQFDKSIDELNELGDEIDQNQETPSKEERNEVTEHQMESQEMLQQNQPKKSTSPQKKSIQKMKEMQQQLSSAQSSMQMEMDLAGLEMLRQIVHGLIKLSYDQENLLKEFQEIQQTDPKYIQLGQNQIKIQNDVKVLKDSLLSFANKDFQLGSPIIKELGELDEHLDKASENIRERRKANAGTEMQLTMTSINNLALMLNKHFEMMMEMMANGKKSSSGNMRKGKKEQPGLGELQMKLNNRIQQLKESGTEGRQLSEELARMAAEQERIRRALQEMQEDLRQRGGKPGGTEIPEKMEETEMELVNKQITELTIKRQAEILTRLLEAEKSMREQKMDDERKGETAKDYDKEIPRAFEEYLRLREKEVELLKTVPPKLFPYYKKEVNEYFKRIGGNE